MAEPEVGEGNAATRFHQSAWLPPVHKETAGPCVRIVEDGEVSRCRQTPFAALPSMRNLAPEIRGGKHERSRRRDPDSEEPQTAGHRSPVRGRRASPPERCLADSQMLIIIPNAVRMTLTMPAHPAILAQ